MFDGTLLRMESLVFNFDDARSQESFVERCLRDYGMNPTSLYVSKSARFVVIDKVDSGLVQRLRNERGVSSVFEDARLEPFL
jgi:hypothetical protein